VCPETISELWLKQYIYGTRVSLVVEAPTGCDRCHNNTHKTTGRTNHQYGICCDIDGTTYQKIEALKMEEQQLPSKNT
jgi:hypothetical protein